MGVASGPRLPKEGVSGDPGPRGLSWERGAQPLVAREGSLAGQVDALPAGRAGGVCRDPALRRARGVLGSDPWHSGAYSQRDPPPPPLKNPPRGKVFFSRSLGGVSIIPSFAGSKLCGLLPSTVRSETCGFGAASPASLCLFGAPRLEPGLAGLGLGLAGIRGLGAPVVTARWMPVPARPSAD